MKPLFPFYGSKWRDAKRYPPPRNGKVVEPFAGSAGYSCYYAPADVTLIDVDPYITGVWRYLIGASSADIRALPDLEVGQHVDTLDGVCQEARWLIGFWLNRGSAQPKKTKTAFSARTERSQLVWSERARVRIASEVEGIRHWKVIEGRYDDCSIDPDATYFIDPPYVDKGRYYRCRNIDYAALADWCRTVPDGIVCEQRGATWFPFEPLATIKSTKGTSAEVVGWTGPRPQIPNHLIAQTNGYAANCTTAGTLTPSAGTRAINDPRSTTQ